MATTAPQLVDAGVVDDAVQPAAHIGVAAEPRQRPVGADVGLLEGVLHPDAVATEQLVRQPAEPVVVAAHEVGERRTVIHRVISTPTEP